MMPNFTYYPTITEPQKEAAQWNGDTRFIEEIWKDDTIVNKMGFRPTPEDTHIFLCGNPYMIDSMIELAQESNFKEHSKKEPGQIHFEKF